MSGYKRKLPKIDRRSKALSESEDECFSNTPESNSGTETDTSIEDYQEKRSKEKNKKERQKATKKTQKEEKNELGKISKEKEKKRIQKKGKMYDFNDFDDVSIDMTDDFVSKKRIKLSSNLLLQCKMINVSEKGRKFSYAALVFERKTNDGKNFEFNLPFNLAPRLVKALEVMLADSNNIKRGIIEKK